MPVINRSLTLTLPLLSNSNGLITHSRHLHLTTPLTRDHPSFHRTDIHSSSFTSSYDPNEPARGPLSQAPKTGAPRLTPSVLKEHLDKYVVGQDRAKKVTCVAIYNHYQRIRELQRQEAEAAAKREQRARWDLRERERNSHPVENEYPGQIESVDLNAPYRPITLSQAPSLVAVPPDPLSPSTTIEKSNLLLLGPSGVGKTYILSTLARTLSVPFATVDCSSLTQAGYIGTDIESSIERLLLAANHDISRCETGIIFFDEVDKLAKPAVMTHGRDVSGEGVQQGLLKMIEGTTITVTAKSDRNSKTERDSSRASSSSSREPGGPGKPEQYTVDTTNILFVFAGAFVGLERIISSRLSTGSSLGFTAPLKSPSSSSASSNITSSTSPSNVLAHTTPPDLQSYGLIPELLGRIPVIVPLTPLSLDQLVSILTEPRNSLVKQYIALFATSGITLRFTTGALHAIAERAMPPSPNSPTSQKHHPHHSSGIGARGLRSIMETVLAEVMFRGPGSSIRYCLVDEKFVREQGRMGGGGDSTHRNQQQKQQSTNTTRHLDTSYSYNYNYNTISTRSSNHNRPVAHDITATDILSGSEAGGASLMPRCWSRVQSRAFEDAYESEEIAWKEKLKRREAACDDDAGIEDTERNKGDGSADLGVLRRVGGSGM